MFLIMILIIDIGIALTQRYSKQEDNYLDYSIILGIQKDELKKIGIKEELTSWGDEVISFTPKRFRSEENVKLIELDSDSEIFNLKVVEGLRELEWQANKNRELFEENNIMKLLERICCLSSFSIIIKEDDTSIEELELNNKNYYEINTIFANALDWENPQSLKICKNWMNLIA